MSRTSGFSTVLAGDEDVLDDGQRPARVEGNDPDWLVVGDRGPTEQRGCDIRVQAGLPAP
ncbi:hypothetical protein ACWEN4_19180 [Streptomyces violaceorubidus]